jgi:hypothetical protein
VFVTMILAVHVHKHYTIARGSAMDCAAHLDVMRIEELGCSMQWPCCERRVSQSRYKKHAGNTHDLA